jgi:hypothetical protein
MPSYSDVGLGVFQLAIKALRIIIGDSRWLKKVVEERLQKRLSSWKGKLLSLERRLVLINSVLTNMILYMIYFFQLPRRVLHRLDYFRSRFFWEGDNEKKKYRLKKWSVVCRPKDQDGLGVDDLEVKTDSC